MSKQIQPEMPYFDADQRMYLPSNALDLILKEQSIEDDNLRLQATAESFINDQDPQYEG